MKIRACKLLCVLLLLLSVAGCINYVPASDAPNETASGETVTVAPEDASADTTVTAPPEVIPNLPEDNYTKFY